MPHFNWLGLGVKVGLTVLACLAMTSTSQGIGGLGDVVFDPQVYMAQMMSYANTLKSTINEGVMIANQAKSLEYQVQSLWNEAKNLQANPLRLLGQIEGLWGAYNGIMANADGLSYNLIGTAAKFEKAYPQMTIPGVDVMVQKSAAMLDSIRKASKTAVSTQSVYDRLCTQLEATKQGLTAAQASQGALQIAQAQAQMQGVNNELLGNLAQLEAANGRVQTEYISMQVAERQQGQVENDHWIAGFGKGFKLPGQGQGIELK